MNCAKKFGISGPTDPQENLLPLTVWTVWWIGIAVMQGVLGDVWRWINPWSGLARVVQGQQPPPFRLPKSVGVWPAVILLVGFQIFAIADIAPNDPRRLAAFAAAALAVTCAALAPAAARAHLFLFRLLLKQH